MDSFQLTRALHAGCEEQFAGVYSVDQLPGRMSDRPRLLVVNTDISAGLGRHWVAIYLPSDGEAPEFFDSTGRAPDSYHPSFERFLVAHGPKYKFQTLRLQGYGSQTCGLFCLYYGLKRCAGRTMEEIVKFFRGRTGCRNDDVLRGLFPGLL